MVGPWQIVEGVFGTWHYHLAPADGPTHEALCGARTPEAVLELSKLGWGSVKTWQVDTEFCGGVIIRPMWHAQSQRINQGFWMETMADSRKLALDYLVLSIRQHCRNGGKIA